MCLIFNNALLFHVTSQGHSKDVKITLSCPTFQDCSKGSRSSSTVVAKLITEFLWYQHCLFFHHLNEVWIQHFLVSSGCFALCTNESHAAVVLMIWGQKGRGWEDVCQKPDNHISPYYSGGSLREKEEYLCTQTCSWQTSGRWRKHTRVAFQVRRMTLLWVSVGIPWHSPLSPSPMIWEIHGNTREIWSLGQCPWLWVPKSLHLSVMCFSGLLGNSHPQSPKPQEQSLQRGSLFVTWGDACPSAELNSKSHVQRTCKDGRYWVMIFSGPTTILCKTLFIVHTFPAESHNW